MNPFNCCKCDDGKTCKIPLKDNEIPTGDPIIGLNWLKEDKFHFECRFIDSLIIREFAFTTIEVPDE